MTTTERHLTNMMLIAGQRWIETGKPEDLATLHRRINQLQHYRDLVKAQCAGKNRDPRYVQDVSVRKTHGKRLQSRQSSKRTLEYRSYKKTSLQSSARGKLSEISQEQHGKHTSKQRSSLRIFDTSFVFTTIENTQLDHSLIGFLGIIENLIKWLDSTS